MTEEEYKSCNDCKWSKGRGEFQRCTHPRGGGFASIQRKYAHLCDADAKHFAPRPVTGFKKLKLRLLSKPAPVEVKPEFDFAENPPEMYSWR